MSCYKDSRKRAFIDEGFNYFVHEFKLKHNLYESFERLKEIAQPFWMALDDIERRNYDQMASGVPGKFTKFQLKQDPENQIEDEEKMQLVKSRGHDKISKEVNNCLGYAQAKQELHDTVFYFLNASNEGTTDTPTEFAIAAFNLRDGIIKDLCVTIKDFELTETTCGDDCEHLLLKLVNFFKPLQKMPMLYFTNGNLTDDYESYKTNVKSIKKIFDKAGEYQISENLQIYPLNYLLYYMRQFLKTDRNDSLDAAHETIKNDLSSKFQTLTMGCDIHEAKNDATRCCLSLVRRSSYIIAKYCSDRRQYQLFEGFHYPIGMREEYET